MAQSQLTPTQQRILQLESTVKELSNQIQTLLSRTARPKAILPDPNKFNSTIQRWDTWRPSIKAKLLVDGQAIGNSCAQFYY
ncbi:hypothetical protein EG329_011484, partial [Mollisiaceae sp. DMI_Dod_QoI]